MSERLAFSSALSVLMMSAYVLFGPNAARVELGPDSGMMAAAVQHVVPQVSVIGKASR